MIKDLHCLFIGISRYCTGGIRCEMASAYIRSKGAGFENVFQVSSFSCKRATPQTKISYKPIEDDLLFLHFELLS